MEQAIGTLLLTAHADSSNSGSEICHTFGNVTLWESWSSKLSTMHKHYACHWSTSFQPLFYVPTLQMLGGRSRKDLPLSFLFPRSIGSWGGGVAPNLPGPRAACQLLN